MLSRGRRNEDRVEIAVAIAILALFVVLALIGFDFAIRHLGFGAVALGGLAAGAFLTAVAISPKARERKSWRAGIPLLCTLLVPILGLAGSFGMVQFVYGWSSPLPSVSDKA